MIILKVAKKRSCTLSSEDTFLEKTQRSGGGEGGWQIDPSPLQAVLALNPEAAVQRCSENF